MGARFCFVVLRWILLLGCSQFLPAQSQAPVFVANANLQSIAVQVADKQGNDVKGLTASDFTLLEDGRPQKIAFFEAEAKPVSLAILIDSGRSMDFGGKLDRARLLLDPLILHGPAHSFPARTRHRHRWPCPLTGSPGPQ